MEDKRFTATPFNWEIIDRAENPDGFSDVITYRARTRGGWVLRVTEGQSSTICYIPDSRHVWRIKVE